MPALTSRIRPDHKILFSLTLFIHIILISGCTLADESGVEGRAAILVQHSDGETTTACVSFEGEEIDGEELLNQSGVPYVADLGNSMGSILCSIEGDGCNFPSEKCFCQCSDPGSCAYWSYFVKGENGDWVYAPVGARMREVHDGDFDAWVWVEGAGFGQIQDSLVLPEISFEDICSS